MAEEALFTDHQFRDDGVGWIPSRDIDAGRLLPRRGQPIHTAANDLSMLRDATEGPIGAKPARSAYDLFLTRNVQHAELAQVAELDTSCDLFGRDRLVYFRARQFRSRPKVQTSRWLESELALAGAPVYAHQGRATRQGKRFREFAPPWLGRAVQIRNFMGS